MFKKGQSGNPAGRKAGSVILREVMGDDGVREFASNLKKLAKKNNVIAMTLLAERVFPKPVEEPVKIEGYKEAITFDDKSDVIMKAVTDGEISISQGERLMNTLNTQAGIHEITQLVKDVDELKKIVKGEGNGSST